MIGHVKKLLIGLLFLIFSLPFFGNGFEGSIMLIKESCYDTTFFTYYVADNKIRIEESNSKKVLQNVYIINIVTEDVFIINPEKKLYTKLRKKNQADNEEKHFTIKKTTNSKLVNGIRCYQWRVKNREKNAEISYWVTQNDFNFFEKMVKILNQTERSWEFFNHIPETQGYLPILSVERNLVRDEKMRTSVLQINRRAVDSSLFRIPVGYKLFAI